jgi:hypothetical protein
MWRGSPSRNQPGYEVQLIYNNFDNFEIISKTWSLYNPDVLFHACIEFIKWYVSWKSFFLYIVVVYWQLYWTSRVACKPFWVYPIHY